MNPTPPKNIYITKPVLPNLDELHEILKEVWETGIVTNNGPIHKRFEKELSDYLGVSHISLFSSGTAALLTAQKALNITGEVITTPYSFIATSHTLLHNNLTPVFIDIDPITYNLEPNNIEASITQKTSCIMPVHCYGVPCDVEKIESIAEVHGLKVIYDAAHAFGVKCDCGSILNHGDISVLSFHATKVFNTFEGGAIISKNKAIKEKVDRLKNFGFASETEIIDVGLNGKMNEFQAALGLLQLKTVDGAIAKRAEIAEKYHMSIDKIYGIQCMNLPSMLRYNYAYFPILVNSDYRISRDELYNRLKSEGIYARRYFYPLTTEFSMYRNMPSASVSNLPIANQIANQIICLPIYPELMQTEIDLIIAILKASSY